MHKHIIGMLWLTQEAVLATAHDVALNICDDIDYKNAVKKWGHVSYNKIFTPKQYTDFRCSTNLERFKYCPECGEKIDWKKVRIEIEEEVKKSDILLKKIIPHNL